MEDKIGIIIDKLNGGGSKEDLLNGLSEDELREFIIRKYPNGNTSGRAAIFSHLRKFI